MKLITSLLLSLVSGLVLSQLAACGQKGPLFLPSKPTPISAPGTPGAPAAPAAKPTSAPPSANPAANPAAKAS